MSTGQITYLAILSTCIVASGFFSGSETALIAVPRERVAQLLSVDRRAGLVAALTADPDRMLSTLLVANNFVNILGASVATVLMVDLVGEDWGPWLATGSVTAVVLLIGEITPKSLATRYPEQFSLFVAPTIWRLSGLLRPISRFFLMLSRGLFRLFRIDVARGPAPVTEEDIRMMAELGERSGDIETAEREIIHSLFQLTDRRAREVMTPRPDIFVLHDPVSANDVRDAVAASGHSRFPVIRENLDRLVGVLHVKDLLRMGREPNPEDIRRALRAPYFVPETKPLLELLQELRTGRRSFAFVLDEHGGVEGLVTIKDIVSELIGTMQDEYDPGTPAVVALGPGAWIADGRVSVDDLAEETGANLPSGAYNTLGGLIFDIAGRIPDVGETVLVDGLSMTVLRMDRHRVDRVRIESGV
jgi:CBS domain containing-hemolysin-like protein